MLEDKTQIWVSMKVAAGLSSLLRTLYFGKKVQLVSDAIRVYSALICLIYKFAGNNGAGINRISIFNFR